jgi:hypothetical protein
MTALSAALAHSAHRQADRRLNARRHCSIEGRRRAFRTGFRAGLLAPSALCQRIWVSMFHD